MLNIQKLKDNVKELNEMHKLDVYWCRGCDNKFATEANKSKPLTCPYCLQQKDFIYKETIIVNGNS